MDAILTNLKALSEDMLIEVIAGLNERFDDGAEIVLDAALNVLHDSVSSEKFIEVCEGL